MQDNGDQMKIIKYDSFQAETVLLARGSLREIVVYEIADGEVNKRVGRDPPPKKKKNGN